MKWRISLLLAGAMFGVGYFAPGLKGAETSGKRRPDTAWWSLRELVRPAVPGVSAGAGAGNAIDAFVAAEHGRQGLRFSKEATRGEWIRRLYFDLLGLPPTPEEVVAFEGDERPDAYERCVERVLSSPRYGERWGRHWLDVVRYGETHGYDKDQPRPNAWPYRDYVIRSLNGDKPYGHWMAEQIAGDVLFPDTVDGVTGLGFIAAGPWDLIGHAEVPETKTDGKIARNLDRDDMVSNTLNTFCSLTIQCARCHHHKFDPVSMEDYYRLQAVFAALDRANKTYDEDPAVGKRRRELEENRREWARQRKDIEGAIARRGGSELAEIERKISEARAASKPGQRPEAGWHSAIEMKPDVEKWVQVDLGADMAVAAIELAGCYDDFNGIGAGFGFPKRYRVEVSKDAEFQNREAVKVVRDETGADVGNPGIRPVRHEVGAGVSKARYVRVTATRLALRANDYIFALAELRVLGADGRNLAAGGQVTSLDSIEASPRWARANLVDGIYPGQGAGESAKDLARWEAERRRWVSLTNPREVLDEMLMLERWETLAAAELKRLPEPQRVYAGTVHYGSGAFQGTGPNQGRPRPVYVLTRGDVTKPVMEVKPGTVGFVSGWKTEFELASDHSEGERRATLARWLVDPRHPLVWRSIVNRVWHYHFGRGLVDSPNDFGRMGQLPTHPELLDWLAVEFRDSGQSLKRLHRMIVTSRTYRQSSASDPELERLDSDNRYLWRMNRRKLEAEAVRDTLLATAGRLDLRMGGPSFQDFIVEKPEHSPHYEYHLHDAEDVKTHRRSVYRFLVRSQPHPFMTTLDCADSSMSVDKRNETVNALQSLAMRNNKLTLSMAAHFARRLEGEASGLEEQVRRGFWVALGRGPTETEHRALVEYGREFGLANVCRVFFNLNEFAFVD